MRRVPDRLAATRRRSWPGARPRRAADRNPIGSKQVRPAASTGPHLRKRRAGAGGNHSSSARRAVTPAMPARSSVASTCAGRPATLRPVPTISSDFSVRQRPLLTPLRRLSRAVSTRRPRHLLILAQIPSRNRYPFSRPCLKPRMSEGDLPASRARPRARSAMQDRKPLRRVEQGLFVEGHFICCWAVGLVNIAGIMCRASRLRHRALR